MLSACAVQKSVASVLDEQGKCSVLLTGGQSAERLYQAWAGLEGFGQLTEVDFYFGDERCVPPYHADSNYGMVQRALFSRGLPHTCRVFRIEADDSDRVSAARRYSELLPDKIEVALFGVGDDGHVASLFPGGEPLLETWRKVLPVTGKKPPFERLTITPPVIGAVGVAFVLAPGRGKSAVFERVIKSEETFASLPAVLVGNAIWLLDDQMADI